MRILRKPRFRRTQYRIRLTRNSEIRFSSIWPLWRICEDSRASMTKNCSRWRSGTKVSYWRQLLSDQGMPDGMLPALEQAVALLTLCNGKPAAKDEPPVLARTPRLRRIGPFLRITLFDALRRLYPLDGGLTGLRPDLLGETLVSDVLASDDEVPWTPLLGKTVAARICVMR